MKTVTFADPQLLAAGLKTVAMASATHDDRFYLNGVCLEVLAGGTIAYLVATNGNIMACLTLPVLDSPAEDVRMIVSVAAVKILIQQLALCTGPVMLTHKANDLPAGELILTHNGTTYTPGHELIDGKYPDWRRVLLPERRDDRPGDLVQQPQGACFDADLIALGSKVVTTLRKACKEKYNGQRMRIEAYNGGGCNSMCLHTRTHDDADLLVTIMGMRD